MRYNLPILDYLRKILDEHILPLEDPGSGVVEAPWLVDMIQEVEAIYRRYGTI